MKTILCLIAVAVAAPVAAAPEPIHTGAGLVVRTPYAALKTATGRAQFLSAVEESARRLCRDVHPRSDRTACANKVIAGVERQSIPQVREALRLAVSDRDTVELAAR